MNDDSVFIKPTEPKNSFELLKWLIFEPLLLENYSNTLTKKQTLMVLLRAYPYIILIGCLIYSVMVLITVTFDMPLHFPCQCKTEFVTGYQLLTGFEQKLYFVIQQTIVEFIKGLAGGLAVGLAGGLAFGLAFYISYFHLYCYPFYFIRSLFGISFYTSPYHQDAVIWLPIWGVEKQFRFLALNNPDDAVKFIRFLREYRPLQSRLADSITHATQAGFWLNNPLVFEVLNPPAIENKKLQSTDKWLKQLQELKNQLISYRQQNQLALKKQYLEQFLKQLDSFINQTLVENPRWRDEYLQALALWQKVGLEELQDLELQIKQQQPIANNIYLAGDPLKPEINQSVFLGRDDLKNELARRIYNSQQMPMFLFQGQRRVGKTSLLNFLEPLLGCGFKVVYQDMQDSKTGNTVQSWLSDLQSRIANKLELTIKAINQELNWLEAWQEFENCLNNLQLDYKLILALDEYEELHNRLMKDAEQGGRLLAAMRSFSQRQNQIVFLFVGAALFNELQKPNWAEYFVQAQSLLVDYLKKDDALRLITEPVDLEYPEALPEQMFDLTQGHPALLQLLCSEMVNIANQTPKKDMTQADLEKVINQVLEISSPNVPMNIFWEQFCKEAVCKQTVREIIYKKPISDKKSLHRLREHGFIIQENGAWRLRVPLFERWLLLFDRVDLDN